MIPGEATTGDREAVIDLWRACGLTRPWNDPEVDFNLALSSDASTILTLSEDGAILASVMVGFDGHRGWVYYLAADPIRQKSGLGRELMTMAEEWLKARGCLKIQLMVRNDNAEARSFYEALGYEQQEVVTMGRRLDRVGGICAF